MNLQQSNSCENFQLRTKILTESDPSILQFVLNNYLETLAYKKDFYVVDIIYQMRTTPRMSPLCGLLGGDVVEHYTAMIIYKKPARVESKISEIEEKPEAPEEEN